MISSMRKEPGRTISSEQTNRPRKKRANFCILPKEKKFKKKGQFLCSIYKKKGPRSNETMEIGHAYMTE